MPEIADWLKTLGMSEYAERFAENGINVAALPHLTDQDLKDIGVLLGHRRIMLAAISKLAGVTPATPEPAAQAEPKPQDSAERRQITVLFSDLVGSTALSGRMDPEDLREVVSGYQKCVADTVARFGGYVAKYMGDGVLIYFGYPQAHEDDAERAVRAGLELVAAASDLKTHATLQTRVGIATGLVVVGDLIGSGEAQERGIVGETSFLTREGGGLSKVGGGRRRPLSVPSVRAADARRVVATKLRIIIHYFPHQLFDQLLANQPVLLRSQFCKCLCDGINHFIRFTGIDVV